MLKIIWNILSATILKFLNNNIYINLLFLVNCIRLKQKFYYLKIKNPETFNEKINYIKFDYRDQLYPILADKYRVREYVSLIIGDEYLINMIDFASNFGNLDFKNYPNSFVLKINHGSGMNILVKDKFKMDVKNVKLKLSKWLFSNDFNNSREWHYKQIKPGILVEEFMGDNLLDYKFHVCNGKVKFIQVDFDRFDKHTRNLYDIDWNLLKIEYCYPNNEGVFQRPEKLEEMIEISEKLSSKFVFSRVDLYLIQNRIYFGEITFHPEGGVGPFDSREADLFFGKYLEL
jgi:hypothetical protein